MSFETELSKPSRWALMKLMLRSWRTWRVCRTEPRQIITGNFTPRTRDMSSAGPPPAPRKK